MLRGRPKGSEDRVWSPNRGRRALPDDQRLVQQPLMLLPAEVDEIHRLFPRRTDRGNWLRAAVRDALASEWLRREDEARKDEEE